MRVGKVQPEKGHKFNYLRNIINKKIIYAHFFKF